MSEATKKTPRNRKPLSPETYDFLLGKLREGRPTALARSDAYQLAADVDARDEELREARKLVRDFAAYASSLIGIVDEDPALDVEAFMLCGACGDCSAPDQMPAHLPDCPIAPLLERAKAVKP